MKDKESKERMKEWQSMPSPKPSWETFKRMLPLFGNNSHLVLIKWRTMMHPSDYIVDFSNNKFILFNVKNRSEEVITALEASRLDSERFVFSSAAKNVLEEIQYDEAMSHYLGE